MKFSDFKKKEKSPARPAEPPAAVVPAPPPAEKAPPKPLFPRGASPASAPAAKAGGPTPPAAAARTAAPSPAASPIQRRLAQESYGHAVSVLRDLLRELDRGSVNFGRLLNQTVTALLQNLETAPHPLLALTTRSTASNYLYAHATNVSILSMYVAQGLDWDRESLRQIGLAALLHDIGMVKYLGLAAAPRALTPEEYQEVRLHPLESQKLLENIDDIEENTRRTISGIIGQAHERKGGSGYPKAVTKSADIHMAAQIIGLVDVYEAMSHYRAWREPLIPHEAVKKLIREHAPEFDRKLLQAFVERITLYPPGSFVELSGGEIATVIEIHHRTPTLPAVKVRLDGHGRPISPPRVINLAQNRLIHISRAIDETKLRLRDRKLLLAFQANRWWIA